MAEADELITWLGFKFKPDAKQNIDKAQKGIDTLKAGVDKLNKFFFGAGGAINYFKQQLLGGAQSLDNMSKLTGMSVTSLQKWKYAAQASGVSFESLIGNLQNFKKVGIDVMALSARLSTMSDKIALQYKDQFGISDDMYILMRKGPQEIQRLLDAAPIVPEEDLKKTVEANKELAKATAKIEAIKTQLMVKFAPMILSILEALNRFLDRNEEFIKNVMGPLVKGLLMLFVGGKLLAGAKAIVSVLQGGVGLLNLMMGKKAIAATTGAVGAGGTTGAVAGGVGGLAMGAVKGVAGIGTSLYTTAQAGYAFDEYTKGNTLMAAEHGLKGAFTGLASLIGGPLAGAAMAGILEITEEVAEVAGDAIGNLLSDGSDVANMTHAERLRYMQEKGYINNSQTNSGNTVNVYVANTEQGSQIVREASGGQNYTPAEPGNWQ